MTKAWIKPTIINLENASVSSGFFSDGAEQVLTCGGGMVPGPGTVAISMACVSSNPMNPYLCTGIIPNGYNVFLTSLASAATIAQACS